MDDDTAFAKRHGWACVDWCAYLVVVDYGIAIVHIPDAQAEFVDAATASNLPIDHSDWEAVLMSASFNTARTLELGFGCSEGQPLGVGGMEMESACFQLEFGFAC